MSSRYLKPRAILGHVLVLVVALTCLRLGWWQWDVFQEARGTGQNLGYAMLWPVFAGSFIYMWLRFLHLEGTQIEDGDRPTAAGDGALTADDVEAYAARLGAASPVDEGQTDDSDRAAEVRRLAEEQRHGRLNKGQDARTVGMGYVTVDDDDDPELAAYNRALAQLADEDDKRAR